MVKLKSLTFQNGEVVGRQVGVSPKNVYTEAIDAYCKHIFKKKFKKGLSYWQTFFSLEPMDIQKELQKASGF
jgi:hypothetical protein